MLPLNRMPISRWSDLDEALLQVTEGIQATIDNIDRNESQALDSSRGPEPIVRNDTMDVGIVIALKEEFSVLFDEIRTSAQPVRDLEANEVYYTFERNSTRAGRPYRCVATFIGGMGPTKAALLTQKMITRWHPTTLVLPGIAGSLNSSVRLGDIVIADQVDGYLENAKASPTADQQGYMFELSGEVYRASYTILKLTQNFEFTDPGIFEAWRQGTVTRQMQLLGEQRAGLLSEKLLHEQAQVINGPIASGPIVGAAEPFVKWLKTRNRKYMAIEMEAMGLMAAVYDQASAHDTLVLRAISDNSTVDKARFDTIGDGVLRRYAMQNAIQLLWSFLDAGLLQQR
ncbi:MAG: hypothetical protein PVSMB5_29190 [Ktedonobacteraceae bacterium]